MTELYLYENQITDISPLAHLTQLTTLDLSNNQIKDVTPLTKLTSLEKLLLKGNPIEDTSPLNALLNGNPGLDIDIEKALIREEGGPTVTASTWQPLTWITLNESGVKLTLSSGTFHTDEKQIADAITISGIPDISISKWNWYDDFEVDRHRSGTEIQFRLTYEGSHTITTDAMLTITVEPGAIAHYNGSPLTSEIPVTVPTEAELTEISQALEVSTSAPLTGSTLGGNIVTLKLHSETFNFSFPSRWVYTLINGLTVSGIPGIGINDEYEDYGVEYVSRTEVKFKLTYEGNIITADSVLTLTVDPKAVVGYNGDPYTLEIPVTGVTEDDLSQTLTASTAYPLTAVTLHGSIVTLKLTDAVFEARVWNYIKISGIPAVTKSGRKVSDTKIKYELSFFDNIDTDATLTFTVQPDGIMGYNGPPLTAEIPVSASTEIEHTGELVASTPIPLTKTTLNKNYVRLTLQNKSYQASSYAYDEPVIGISGIPGVKTARFGSGSHLSILSETEIRIRLFFSGNLDNDATLTFTVPPSLIKDYYGPPLTASLPVSAATEPQALVPESSLPLMYWINTDTDKIESVAPFEAVTQGVESLTVDVSGGKIYWSESGSSDSTIKRANLDGTVVENFTTLSTTPHHLSVDSANNRLYWADTLQNSIQSADLNGKNIKTLIQVGDDITSMALDVEGNKLYWGDAQYRIHCMNLDGTNVERLLAEEGTGWNPWVGSIAIAEGKIYWIEGIGWYLENGKVHRANLNGTNVETLTHQLGVLISIAVDTVANKVYWTNSLGGIQRMDLSSGEVKSVISGITSPGNLVLVPGTQQTTTDAAISISPTSVVSPVVGEQLEVHLNITGGEDVRGYQATVQFDTTALRYVESSNGDYLPDGALFIPPAVDGNLVKLTAIALTGESSGAGTLATLTFEVVAVKASTLTLSNVLLVNNTGEKSLPQVENGQITAPSLNADVNGDGSVDLQDLAIVQSHLGQTGQNEADVNGDGVVDVADLALVAGAIENGAAAPSLHPEVLEIFRSTNVKQWLSQLQQLNLTDAASQRGIQFLEQLLAALTPKETALLANYPNPFNPETWIPYHLAKDADVTLHIYAVNGTLVRTLSLGHQAAGMYQNRSRAAHWDGKNAFGESVASGLYFYTLTTGDFTATRKMLIMK